MDIRALLSNSAISKYTASPGSFLGPQVTRGTLTWNAEGMATKGSYYSRTIHYPGGVSGVTIGRGYDMKFRSGAEVIQDLTKSGVPRFDAELISRGAKLFGKSAGMFVLQNKDRFPELSADAEINVFQNITYPEMEKDVMRLVSKSDVVKKYGSFDYQQAPDPVKELLIDLRYRGDYTPITRRVIQPLLVRGDWDGLNQLMNNEQYWNGIGVPRDRIHRRADFATKNL